MQNQGSVAGQEHLLITCFFSGLEKYRQLVIYVNRAVIVVVRGTELHQGFAGLGADTLTCAMSQLMPENPILSQIA